MHSALAALMPSLAAHRGAWAGTYRHLDGAGQLVDQHRAHVVCEFPAEGPYAYIQHNHFIWPDGREQRAVLPGVLRGDRLYWDVETFSGCAWEGGHGVILLRLDRKDDPGASFTEIIVLAPGGRTRARTWHWFKDGALYRRTLCDEARVA